MRDVASIMLLKFKYLHYLISHGCRNYFCGDFPSCDWNRRCCLWCYKHRVCKFTKLIEQVKNVDLTEIIGTPENVGVSLNAEDDTESKALVDGKGEVEDSEAIERIDQETFDKMTKI